jgi:hypothetical protein
MRCVLPALTLLVSSTAISAAADLPVVDDCTEAIYLDRTAANADRELRWDFNFPADLERCLKIRVGQSVRWQGNFGDHPLEGDQGDDPNPIDSHAAGLVTFARPGVFGFRCNFHLEMQGAIWVVPDPAAPTVPWGDASTAIFAGLLLLAIGARSLRSDTTMSLAERAACT